MTINGSECPHISYKEKGDHYYKIRDYHSAIKYYAFAINYAIENPLTIKHTDLATYYSNRAAAYTMLHLQKEAMYDCDSALEIDVSFFKGYYRKGKILSSQGRINDAVDVYEKGLKYVKDEKQRDILEREKEDMLSIKAKYGVAKDSFQSSAENILNRLKRKNDDDTDEIDDSSSNPTEEMEETLNLINDILNLCPEFIEVNKLKIRAMTLLERNNEAFELTNKLLMKNHGDIDWELLYLKADCMLNLSKLAEAVDILKNVTQKNPSLDEAVKLLEAASSLKEAKNKADSAFCSGKFEAADKLYSEALDVCPPDKKQLRSKLFFNRAVADANLQKHEEVITYCTEALALDNNYLKALLRRAASYVSLSGEENCIKAIEDYDRAEALAIAENSFDLSLPGWKEAMLLKGRALGFLKKEKEAYDLTTNLMEGGMEGNSKLLLLRAKSLFYMGNSDEALTILDDLVVAEPNNTKAITLHQSLKEFDTNYHQANEALKKKDYDGAKESLDLALSLCPPDNTCVRKELFFSRAKVNSSLRDHQSAIDDCSEAITIDEGFFKVYLKRAAAYLILGGLENCEKAIADYETAKTLASNEDQIFEIDKKLSGATSQKKREEDGDQTKNFYSILGVSRDATESEIKKNYRKMALQMHPDRRGSLGEKKNRNISFRDINLAYEVLSDAQRRDRYDYGVENP